MANPTLPQLTMSTTDPLSAIERTVDCSSTGGYANTAARLAAFIAALADAKFKDYIITEPGDTLDGNFTLKAPATSGLGATSGYVVIRPRGFDSVVPIGQRATSNSGMTTLRSVASSGGAGLCDTVLQAAANGTSYYWLSGLEVVPKASTFCQGALVSFSPTNIERNASYQTDHMMVDRCYIHGDDPSGTNGGPGTLRGIIFAGTYQGCIHSTIDDIKCTDNQGEPQCITMAYGAGPVLIENNLLGCTTENVLFESPTGEARTVSYVGNALVITTAQTVFYDAVGKLINFSGSPGTTRTITAVDYDTAADGSALPGTTRLTINSAISASSYTGTAYIAYARDLTPGFFPGDITIKRNYFRKKNAWNIAHATFERTSGSDTGLTNMTILASDNTKIEAGTAPGLTDGRQIYVTGGTGWTTGYAYVMSIDGSSNYQMNRAMGTTGSTGGTAKLKYSVKNALEFKSGSRILVEGNTFDTSWAGGQNFILTFTPRYVNSPPGDLTFRYNVVKNAWGIMAISASDNTSDSGAPGPFLEQHRIHMHDNVFENIRCASDSPYTSPGATTYFPIQWFIYDSVGTLNGVTNGPRTMDDFVFENNTIAGASSQMASGFMNLNGYVVEANLTKAKRWIFRNNVIFLGDAGGVYGTFKTASNQGSAALDKITVNTGGDTRSVTKNIFFDTTYNVAGELNGATDAGNVSITTANRADLSFADYAGGNYTITGGTYDNWGTDGTDPGADMGALNNKTAGTLTGIWATTGFRYLPIRWP